MFPTYFIDSKLKKTTYQKDIIKLIAKQGNQSKNTIIEELFKKDFKKIKELKKGFKVKQKKLSDFYDKHYPYVFNLVKELHDQKQKNMMLQKAEEKKNYYKINEDDSKDLKSKPQQYYSLTENSLEWLINYNLLSIDEFWKLVFYTNDKTHKNQPNFDDILFAQYEEKNNIQLSKDYFLPDDIKFNLENFRMITSLNHHDHLLEPIHYKILKTIGINKSSTSKKLVSEISFKISKLIESFSTKEKMLENFIEDLKNDGFIQELNQKDVVTYALTHSGLLFLLYTEYSKEFRMITMKSTTELRKGFKSIKDTKTRSKIRNELSLIFKHNSHLLPEILEEENRKMLEIDDYYLMCILCMIYFDGNERFFRQNNFNNYLLLSRLRYLKEIDSIQKIKQFHSSGINILTELIKNRKKENHYNFTTKLSDEFFNTKSKIWKKMGSDRMFEWILYYYNNNPNMKKDINKKDSNELTKIKGIAMTKLFKYHLMVSNDSMIEQDEIMKQKILFDFLLAFRELENKQWNKIKSKIKFNKESVEKWHDQKIKELIDFGKIQYDNILMDGIA